MNAKDDLKKKPQPASIEWLLDLFFLSLPISEQAISLIQVIRCHASELFEKIRFDTFLIKFVQWQAKIKRAYAFYVPIIGLTNNGLLFAILYYGHFHVPSVRTSLVDTSIF